MTEIPPYPYPDFEVPALVPSPRLTHLSHVHMHTTDLDASVRFVTDIIGMVETHREDGSVYLRAWGEWMHHSLVLSGAPESGIECMAFRVQHPSHIEAFAERLQMAGTEVEHLPAGSEIAQGEAIRFIAPGGHQYELFYDFERIDHSEHAPSRLINQPMRFPGKGVAARRIDHVSTLVTNPGLERRWMEQVLGFHATESCVLPDGREIVNSMAVTPHAHDVNVFEGPASQLHHFAYRVDSLNELYRAAEIYAENSVSIDAGPGKHGGSQGYFLYAKEPGGNRLELYAGGYEIFEPDWKVIVAGIEALDFMNVWVGAPMDGEFLTSATPSRPVSKLPAGRRN